MSLIQLAKSLKEKSKEEIIKEYIELYKEKEKIENEFKKYKNAHTPSSANKHIKPDTIGLKAKIGAKRGAPKGHKGATLILQHINKIVRVIAKLCTACRSTNIRPTGYIREKTIICLQKAKKVIKRFKQVEYRCDDCHLIFLAPHKDMPEKGIYDKTIQSLVNYFKFKARMTHGTIVDAMNTIFDIPMTEPTSLEITRRASEKLKPKYEELEKKIKEEDIVSMDETSCSVEGVNHWLWVFCNSLISLFKFNKTRGGDIVERTLGDKFHGKIVSDGWATYYTYSTEHGVLHQRCWSHPLREVKFECKKRHPDLYRWYCDIFEKVKKGKRYKHEKRRREAYEKCKAELALWVGFAKVHKDLKKLATLIENGGENWFTAILHPELPLDNNEAERSLRPFVVMRKIIGCLRSELGMRNYEIMLSLVSTWEKEGKNVFYTLENTL